MNTNRIWIAAACAAALVSVGGYGIYQLGLRQGSLAVSPLAGQTAAPVAKVAPVPQSGTEGEAATRRHIASGIKAGDVDAVVGRKVLYYQDPMAPGTKFDRPGKSPFMDMMLVPIYADGGDADPGKLTISPRMQQNLGLKTAVVSEGTLASDISAIGNIAFNERDQAIVQARAGGFVQRVHVRATLDRIAKGQALLDLYVPDWIAAQEEFLSLRRMQGPRLVSLVEAARQRMRLAGMSEHQIELIELTGQPQTTITIAAPIAGVVTELLVREGMTVSPGATLFRINGLATVWANAEVPEAQAALLRPGARVVARTPALPGTAYEGKVQALLPDVNTGTRTMKARVELSNPGQRLAPGMFVSMQFTDMRAHPSLLVPSDAVIQTGKRSVVMLADHDGRFYPVPVQTGAEAGGQTEIRSGLQAGQRVVVSSQFLIDSEASLRGFEARLNPAPQVGGAPATASAPMQHESHPRTETSAKVEAIGKDTLTLSHGAIESLKWPPMTMEFKRPAVSSLPARLKAGDQVAIEFYTEPDGIPQLTRVTPLAATGNAVGSKP
jgi:membrane fusion protein, copper/silver efflux system